jgi:hypothetical protein
LADHVIPALHYLDDAKAAKLVDPAYNYIKEGVRYFQDCVKEGLITGKAKGLKVFEGLEGPEFDVHAPKPAYNLPFRIREVYHYDSGQICSVHAN